MATSGMTMSKAVIANGNLTFQLKTNTKGKRPAANLRGDARYVEYGELAQS